MSIPRAALLLRSMSDDSRAALLRSLDPLLSQHLQLLLDADRHIEGMVAIQDLVMALPTELLLDYMQRVPAGGHRAAGRTRCHCAQRCRR